MTRKQVRRLIIGLISIMVVIVTSVPAFTALSVRWAQVDIGVGQETYQYVAHDHDWDDELAASEAEIAVKNQISNWYVGLEHWDRVLVALVSWALLVIALVFLYNVVNYELAYQAKKKRAIKIRPVAY